MEITKELTGEILQGLLHPNQKFLDKMEAEEYIPLRFLTKGLQLFDPMVGQQGEQTFNVPKVGNVVIRTGTDFRTGGQYTILSINGVMVLYGWPSHGEKKAQPNWMLCPPSDGKSWHVNQNIVFDYTV